MIQHKQMPPLTDGQRALVCEGERVDYLLREEAYIIQNPAYFPFSLDAVLLADFVKLPKKKALRVMDFCSGGGVIPILLAHRTSGRIEGIEIQAPIAEMAQRTVELNGLSHQVTIHQGDIKDLTKPKQEYDLITCNPPFFTFDSSPEQKQAIHLAIARHEILLSLDQWIAKAGLLLKDKGRLFLVFRTNRLDDLMTQLLSHHFAIHRMRFVHPKAGQLANMVLVEARYRGGLQGVRVEAPLVVHQEDGTYSEEMRRIYYGDPA